jgi:EmrB/QacA subfamily drug resistance transporter
MKQAKSETNKTRPETKLPKDAAEYKRGIRKWLPVAVLGLALMIIVLDTTILNVSLKTIVNDLHTDLRGIQWVITAYSLTLAALTITGGRLGDLFGRKRMFVIGAVIFAAGSFITSISNSVGTMIAGESIIEGVGAAMMMPATASLLVANYKGRDRAIAFGVWGGIAGAASALGPIVGGFLTTNFSWRWAFRINVFVAAVLLLGSWFISESRDREEKRELDFIGVFLSSFGLLSFVFGIIESERYGWWHAKEQLSIAGHTINMFGLSLSPFAMILGIVLLSGFIFWQRYLEQAGHTPLVSPQLFKNRQFTSGIMVTTMLGLGQVGLIFALPVYLQSVHSLDALHTGIAMLPMSLTMLIAAPVSGFIGKHFRPRSMIQAGLAVNVLATLVLRLGIRVDADPSALIPGLVLFGIGFGLVMAQISNLTLSAVSIEEAGEASGVNNTLRQVGSSLGAAVIGAALVVSLGHGLSSGVLASDVIAQEQKPPLAASLSRQASEVELGGNRDKSVQTLPATVQAELKRIAHEASAHASRQAILFNTAFALGALALTFLLPKSRDVERNESATAGH